METIKLDLIPGKKMPSLHASQYDEGREHGIDLFENGVAYKLDGTETLTINERKGDDCICSLDIENAFAETNHIVFASTEQMCAVWGNNLCELVIKKGDVSIGTLNFILEIEPSPTEGGIESESEISNLERQITEITEQVIGDDYYTAEQTDEAIATAIEGKADKTYVDTELGKKADKTDTYTKTEVDSSLNNKMDKANPTGTGKIAVGNNVVASGGSSQAFGASTTASGAVSHAEGIGTIASGMFSHAEGQNTTASGAISHAEGNYTVANHKSQHVFGEYNIPDDSEKESDRRGNYVEIVGNGAKSSERSNARTLDWSGNETLAGDLTYNGNKSITSEVQRLDSRIDALPEPMVFKGTLGVGGTIQTLPTASAENEGYTYKVITAGTYAGTTAKVGDVFTSDGSTWVLIPSGDEDSDTWRAIKVNGVEKLGNGISSGSLDVVDTDNIEAEFDNDGNKLKIKTKNIYTQSEVDTLIANAIDSVLPTDSVSKSAVANFETDYAKPIELKAYIEAVQASGTPTPSTPLPISGWSQTEVTQADENMSTVEQITISLGDTYYGGYVTQDMLGHRQLVVTHGIKLFGDISFSRSNNGGTWQNYLFYAQITDKPKGGVLKCSNYEYVVQAIASMQNEKIVAVSTNKFIYIRDDAYTTVQDFKTANANTQLVYPLAEPIIIDLPDGEPITALVGTNNVFADSGDMECSFKCGVAMYVDNHSGGGNRSVNLAKSIEEEVKEEPKDEPETRQEK